MRPITKTDLSKLAGVSQAAVSKAVREGRVPHLPDGTIDADSTECIAYITAKTEQKQRKAKKSKVRPKRKAAIVPKAQPNRHPSPPTLDESDEEQISGAMDKLTLERRKLKAQTQQIELKNAQIEGRLASRGLMAIAVWAPLETFLVRILTDGARTMSSTLFNIVKSDGTREEVEVAIRDELSTFILPLKNDIIKALKIDA